MPFDSKAISVLLLMTWLLLTPPVKPVYLLGEVQTPPQPVYDITHARYRHLHFLGCVKAIHFKVFSSPEAYEHPKGRTIFY